MSRSSIWLCELDDLEIPPQATTDDFGLVQPGHGIGEGVVQRIARAPDRRLNPGLGAPLRIPDREILGAAVTLMHEVAVRRSGIEGLITDRKKKTRAPVVFLSADQGAA